MNTHLEIHEIIYLCVIHYSSMSLNIMIWFVEHFIDYYGSISQFVLLIS